MRISSDLINGEAAQRVDPNNDRALILRGYKITMIENLGITKDIYGCIDLSDNEINRIENIPKLTRLRSLFLANNSISRIAHDAFDSLPELTSLVLSNNRISRLATLIPLGNLKRLERISLIHNPVCRMPYYREFIIHLLGYSRTLRFIDFQIVSDSERAAAKAFFSTPEGIKLVRDNIPETHAAEEPEAREVAEKAETRPAFTPEILHKIQVAIMEATDMDVVNKLERALKSGELSHEVSVILDLQ
jgi:U2 small nuclear ribonucleoprotein A'